MSGTQLAAEMQALSLSDRAATPPPSKHCDETPRKSSKKRPVLVDCMPLPPVDEYHKPEATGVYYYAIYLRDNALVECAVRAMPELANHSPSVQKLHAVDYLCWLVDDPSLSMQLAVVKKRHKKAMPCITEHEVALVLTLFPLEKEAYENRMTAKDVQKLVDALGCKPDWYEIALFI
ncbi:hypothetical protein OH76DRAFT_1421296 [Lentinus brumalis]|uniref:Uncharacterized protein n=1 Tax=Lentinus brumalis TaxID=2498619 RepID=A0A371CW79_9APHY|nr:hypothetical protein OH76DRAFT_1421296 [Polyporus brumalis]